MYSIRIHNIIFHIRHIHKQALALEEHERDEMKKRLLGKLNENNQKECRDEQNVFILKARKEN